MTTNILDVLQAQADIQVILNRYATALDSRDWPALNDVFTENASAHYEGVGQFEGRTAIVKLVRHVLEQCGPTQHLLGTCSIEVDGDTAKAKCYLAAIHAGIHEYEGKTQTVWGEYRDRLVKTSHGWRIVHRELAIIHGQGDIGIK